MMIEWNRFFIFYQRADYEERRRIIFDGRTKDSVWGYDVLGCGYFQDKIDEPKNFPCVITHKNSWSDELIVLRGELLDSFEEKLEHAKADLENQMKYIRNIERISGLKKNARK